jgi:hypothetical protein
MGSPSRWPEYLGSPEPGRTKIRLGLDLPSISCCIERTAASSLKGRLRSLIRSGAYAAFAVFRIFLTWEIPRSAKVSSAVPGSRPSFLNDLSAVVAASDASKRGTELFAFDRRGKRHQVIVFFNSAGAAQNRRNQV